MAASAQKSGTKRPNKYVLALVLLFFFCFGVYGAVAPGAIHDELQKSEEPSGRKARTLIVVLRAADNTIGIRPAAIIIALLSAGGLYLTLKPKDEGVASGAESASPPKA